MMTASVHRGPVRRCRWPGQVTSRRSGHRTRPARGSLTLALLKAMGLPQPEQTEIGIDMVLLPPRPFAAPELPAKLENGDYLSRQSVEPGKSGYLFPIEGGRWAALVGERHVAMPPDSVEDFLERARQPSDLDDLRHAQTCQAGRQNPSLRFRREFMAAL